MLGLMGRQGWEHGAVVASHGSDEYYKAPFPSGDAGRMLGYPMADGEQPCSPHLPPQLLLGGLRGDAGGTGVEVDAVRRAQGWSSALGGLQDLRE